MSYDPESDLVELKHRGVVEGFEELDDDYTFGVDYDESKKAAFFENIDDKAKFEESEEYDIIVSGYGIYISST